MTIKLLAFYGSIPPGSLISLDSATETAMISNKQATADMTGAALIV